jgi:hypothetical protein
VTRRDPGRVRAHRRHTADQHESLQALPETP